MISSKEQLEKAALDCGILPFFRNKIKGFSVEEMTAPGMLFATDPDEEGCWEWKGPVIREQTTAYGKFFNRKAGFVSLKLFPHFLNYRRHAYPLKADSMESKILQLVRQNEGLTSTELKALIYGKQPGRRTPADLVDIFNKPKVSRHSIEGPLQRLQMGTHLLIADFEYKYTSRGDRYGWGVALYSTPEIWFGDSFYVDSSPEESFKILVGHLQKLLPSVERKSIENLIK